tara:strand:- start:1922 stop:2170 length:249 start_codon:yes stop_codon:yes gene_type:complete
VQKTLLRIIFEYVNVRPNAAPQRNAAVQRLAMNTFKKSHMCMLAQTFKKSHVRMLAQTFKKSHMCMLALTPQRSNAGAAFDI